MTERREENCTIVGWICLGRPNSPTPFLDASTAWRIRLPDLPPKNPASKKLEDRLPRSRGEVLANPPVQYRIAGQRPPVGAKCIITLPDGWGGRWRILAIGGVGMT